MPHGSPPRYQRTVKTRQIARVHTMEPRAHPSQASLRCCSKSTSPRQALCILCGRLPPEQNAREAACHRHLAIAGTRWTYVAYPTRIKQYPCHRHDSHDATGPLLRTCSVGCYSLTTATSLRSPSMAQTTSRRREEKSQDSHRVRGATWSGAGAHECRTSLRPIMVIPMVLHPEQPSVSIGGRNPVCLLGSLGGQRGRNRGSFYSRSQRF